MTELTRTTHLNAPQVALDVSASIAHSFVIRELHLKRFKRFDKLDIFFDAGLNVIIGQNEQGKSTIVDALIAGLFYSPESRASYVMAHKSWNAQSLYAIDMELMISGVPFTLNKDFEDKYFLLRSHDGSTSFDTVEKGQAFLEDALGVSSAQVFEATGCIRQDMISEISANKKEIDSSLERSLTSAQIRVAASEVMKKIERKLTELKKGIKTRVPAPGPLREIKDLRELQESRMQEMKQELGKTHDLRKQLVEIEREYVQVTQELNAKQQLFERASTRLQAATAIVQLKKDYERIQKDLDTQERLDRDNEYVGERISQLGNYSKIQFDNASKELAKSQALMELAQSRRSDEVPSVPSENTLRSRLFIAAGVAFAIGFLGIFIHPVFYAGFAIAVTLIGYGLVAKNKQQAIRAQQQKQKDEEIQTCKDSCSRILAGFGSQTIDQFEQKKREFESLVKKQESVKSQMNLMGSKADAGKLEEEKRALVLQIEQQQQKISTALLSDVSEESVMQLESDIEQLSSRADSLKQKITAHDAVIKSSDIDPEQVVLLEEEVAQLRERESDLETKLQVLEVAHGALAQARETTLAQSSQSLMKFIEEYMPLITDGRYSKAEVKPNLAVSVFSAEKGEFISPEKHLSQGTIEQIYLVARLALYRMLTGGKTSFMVFDDPFVNFDETRREAAMRLLKQFSAQTQIILLTHSDVYKKFGQVIKI